LINKWYGDIPAGSKNERILPKEPEQTEFREKTIEREVPTDAFYYAFKMGNRIDPEFYSSDTLSDALGRDKSARLYISLKKEQQLVSSIGAYVMGSIEDGLLVVSGKLNDGISFQELDDVLWVELEKIKENLLEKDELNRIMNKIRTSKEFQEQGILNRAMSLGMFELLGDAGMINEESTAYQSITPEDIQRVAKNILQKEKCSLLKVKAISND